MWLLDALRLDEVTISSKFGAARRECARPRFGARFPASTSSFRWFVSSQEVVEIYFLEPPNQSGRSSNIVLGRGQKVGMHVVELHAPGKTVHKEELELTIHAAADVFRDGVMAYVVRQHPLGSDHHLYEWPPLSIIHGEPGTYKKVVLLDADPVEATSIQHHANVRVPGEGKVFNGGIPSAKGIAVGRDHIDEIAVGSSDVHIPTREQLRSRCGREQHKAQERQHHGCDF